MPKVYALLVGINEYTGTTPLHGCVADITAVEALLRERVAVDALEMTVLRDTEATRSAIIDGFRSHLRRATASDIAMFYFCGHGSQETVPSEWLALEASGRNQTILSVDARVGDVFDIADKELSALIHEVASSGAQVVTLFDSCHSGGATRDAEDDTDDNAGVARMTESRTGRARTLDDYLDIARELYAPAKLAADGPPNPSHIAITACQADQTAKEFPRNPTPRRGAFTTAFEAAVRALGPSATWSELYDAIRARVRDRATDQMPSLTVMGTATASSVFLAGRTGRRDLTVNADKTGAWWLSVGAVGGIPSPESGNTTTIAIHPRGTFDSLMVTPAPLVIATVAEVLVDRARLEFASGGAPLEPEKQYIGVITRMATAPMQVIVSGTPPETVAAVRTALSSRSGLFGMVDVATPGVPAITITVDTTSALVSDSVGVPLDSLRYSVDSDGLQKLGDACEHLAKWHGTRDRTAIDSSINDQIRIDVVPAAEGEESVPTNRPALAPVNGTVVLQYTDAQPPRVQFRLRNTSAERLYVALVDLSDSFGCSVWYKDWIPAGGTAFAWGGKILKLTIPAWRDTSFLVGVDVMKVFAALSDFDTDCLQLDSLLKPKPGSGEREVVEEDDVDTPLWGTTSLRVETRR